MIRARRLCLHRLHRPVRLPFLGLHWHPLTHLVRTAHSAPPTHSTHTHTRDSPPPTIAALPQNPPARKLSPLPMIISISRPEKTSQNGRFHLSPFTFHLSLVALYVLLGLWDRPPSPRPYKLLPLYYINKNFYLYNIGVTQFAYFPPI